MKHTVEEIRLKNGARGLLINVPEATTMSYEFQFRAGYRFAKSKDIEQVAHILEHMSATGANKKFSAEAFEFEFKKNGAYKNAYTGDVSIGYVADCADFEWQRILELELLSIAKPKLIQEELDSEKGNVRSELTNYLNDYQRILWPRVQQALGEDVLTYRQELQTINNITLSDIKEHHRRTHTTDNMRFVIAGKMRGRKSEIKRLIEEVDLPRGERFSIPRDQTEKAAPTLIRRKDATNLTFSISLALPRILDDHEIDAMNQLAHILTGTMYSRIFGKARKKGLAYYLWLDANVGYYDSGMDLYGEVNHDVAEELFDLIARELKLVLNGNIRDDELEASKSYALGRYQMGAQTVTQIIGFYTGRYFNNGSIKDYEKVPDTIRKVTREKMVETARAFFDQDKWVLAAVSSGERQELVGLSEKLETLFKKG